MSETVYKIVANNSGKLYSAYALGKYRTEYHPGETVSKENLFVYLYPQNAIDHVFNGEEVWECDTNSDPRPAPERVPDYDHTGDEEYSGVSPEDVDKLISDFWEAPYRAGDGPLRLLRVTTGAYLINDVTLIRRIS